MRVYWHYGRPYIMGQVARVAGSGHIALMPRLQR